MYQHFSLIIILSAICLVILGIAILVLEREIQMAKAMRSTTAKRMAGYWNVSVDEANKIGSEIEDALRGGLEPEDLVVGIKHLQEHPDIKETEKTLKAVDKFNGEAKDLKRLIEVGNTALNMGASIASIEDAVKDRAIEHHTFSEEL